MPKLVKTSSVIERLKGLVPSLMSNDAMDDDLDDTAQTLAELEDENKPEQEYQEEDLRPVRAIKKQSLNPYSAKHILLPLGQTSLRPPPPKLRTDDTPPTPPPTPPPPVEKDIDEPSIDPEPRPLIANIGGFPHKLAIRPLAPPRRNRIRANESPATHWLDSMERERQQAKGPLNFQRGGQSTGAPPCGCGGGMPPLDVAPPPRMPEPFVPPILPPAQPPPKCCAKGGRQMFYPSHQATYYTGPGALRSNLSTTLLRTMLPIQPRTDPLPATLRPPCCPPLAGRPPCSPPHSPCLPYCPDAPQPPPALQPQCSPRCPPPTFRPARGPPCGPRMN